MKPVPPHHLLSAYLDGELSAREREEVERLLEQSPEARQELLELEQVGLLLRQLPREALPKSFAPKVLEACLSDTGLFESATPPPRTAQPKPVPPGSGANPRSPRERKKSWKGFLSVAVAVSALGLIVLLSWPEGKDSNRENIAQKSPAAASKDQGALGETAIVADDNLDMKLAGGDANAVDTVNDVHLRQQGQTESLNKLGEESPAQSAAITMAAEAFTGGGRGGANRGTANLGDKELKDLPVGEIVSALDPQGEQVAVVKLVVADRQQALKDLKQLLQKHQIAHESPEELEKDAAAGVSKADASELSAVYVETNRDQLAFVMRDLQKDAAFEKLIVEAPVETDKIDSYFRDSDGKFNEVTRRRMMRFGGAGGAAPGPRALNIEAKKADEAPLPSPEPTAAKEAGADKPAAKTEPPKPAPPSDPAKNGASAPDEPAQTKPSVAGFGAPSADSLRESENAVPEGDRSGSPAKRPARNMQAPAEAAPANSTQRDLTLSPEDLKTLQMPLAKPKSQDPEEAQRQPGGVQRAVTGKPVQVLFVLVDQADKAETASPAAAAPSSKD